MVTDSLLQQGIAALKSGQKAKARGMLEQAVQRDERDEMAWLWLSGAVDTYEERRMCMEKVLAINPGNNVAKQGLDAIMRQQSIQSIGQTRLFKESPILSTEPQQRSTNESVNWATKPYTPSASPTPAPQKRLCPFCAEEIKEKAIVCRHCGRSLDLSPVSSLTPAGFGQRVIASLIDAVVGTTLGLVISFGCGCLMPLLVLPMASPSSSNSGSEFAAVAYTFLQCVVWILPYMVIVAYHSLGLARSGQTVGKRIVGIQVVSSTGKPPTLGQALGRTLAYSLSELILFVGYLFPLWDEHCQALHDKIAGTYVVKRRRANSR